MTIPSNRAWKFVYPDMPETGAIRSGLQISPQGQVALVEGNASIRQAIFMLISTIPGERVMLPDYGCNIHRLLFSPNDDTTAGLAIYYIQQALEIWETRIEILKLDAGPCTDISNADAPVTLDIILLYRVRDSQHTDTINLSVNLAGA
jgi:uncharacterized protein